MSQGEQPNTQQDLKSRSHASHEDGFGAAAGRRGRRGLRAGPAARHGALDTAAGPPGPANQGDGVLVSPVDRWDGLGLDERLNRGLATVGRCSELKYHRTFALLPPHTHTLQPERRCQRPPAHRGASWWRLLGRRQHPGGQPVRTTHARASIDLRPVCLDSPNPHIPTGPPRTRARGTRALRPPRPHSTSSRTSWVPACSRSHRAWAPSPRTLTYVRPR